MTTHMSSSQLPAGQEVLDNSFRSLNSFLLKEIQDSPELKELTEGEYSTPEQAKEALKRYILTIWTHNDKMGEFGFTAPYEDMRRTHQKQTNQVISELADSMSSLFQSLLVTLSNGKIKYDLNGESIARLTRRMEKEVGNMEEGSALLPGQVNTQAQLSLQQLQNFLRQSATRLRSELKKGEFPANVVDRSFKDSKRYTKLKTLFAVSSLGMMIYGHHGFYRNVLENLATTEHNGQAQQAGTPFQPGFYEWINHDWQGVATWPLALISASAVGFGVMKSVGWIRKLWIEDAEAKRLGKPINRKVSTNKQVALIGAGIFAGLSVPLVYEMGGLLEHGVIGHYVAYEAFKTKKAVGKVLDMEATTSPAGKAKLQYDAATNTITLAADRLPAEEEAAKVSGGKGPSWNAKMFPKVGPSIMQNSFFGQATPTEQSAVKSTDQKLRDIGPVLKDGTNFHDKYPTLPSKAKRLGEVFEEDTKALVGQSNDLFGSIYQKRGDAEVKELLDARVAMKKAVDDYLAGLGKANSRWSQRASEYQKLFDTLLNESNIKYKRNTKLDVTISVDPPDVSELKKELERPLPEFKGKSVHELLAVLDGLAETGPQNGGISKTEKNMVLAGILVRVGFLEMTLLGLLVAGIRRAKKYYSVDINALGKQKEYLENLDEKLIQATMATFSGEGWEQLFGKGNTGITHEQAKFIVRELLVSYDAELEKYEGSIESDQNKFTPAQKAWRFVKKRLVPGTTTLFMGDTRIHDERHVASKGRAYEKMSDLARPENSGIAIPEAVVQKIVGYLIPNTANTLPRTTDDISNRYREIVGMISNNFGKLHEHTRAKEAQKIQSEQDEYKVRIREIQGHIPTLTGYIHAIDAVLTSDDQQVHHQQSKELKERIASWIFAVQSTLENSTTSETITALETELEGIYTSYRALETAIGGTI